MPLAIMETFAGREIGRVPFWEVWFGMEALGRRLLGKAVETPQDTCDLAHKLGWDAIRAGGIDIGSPAGREWPVASDGSRHYVPSGIEILAELEAAPFPDQAPMREQVRAATEAAHQRGLAAVLYAPWCFHRITTLVGLEALSFAIHDDRQVVHDAFEWVEQRSRRGLREVALAVGVDLVLFDGDCAFKTGLMVRPDIFRELVFDRTARTVALLREAGIPYVLHSDGKLDELIPMLMELGFTGVHGVEAQANDLADIKARFGRQITLIGNMDVVALTYASVDQVREKTRAMLAVGSPGGKYIAACNTSPLDYIPQQNYLAFAETIREFAPGA